jgi:hypothetical protein
MGAEASRGRGSRASAGTGESQRGPERRAFAVGRGRSSVRRRAAVGRPGDSRSTEDTVLSPMLVLDVVPLRQLARREEQRLRRSGEGELVPGRRCGGCSCCDGGEHGSLVPEVHLLCTGRRRGGPSA